MSTYLLLRNNKQTGPFTIEEIKRLSLKSYDLVWIEGKSAAWRYPGEIPEFTSFAPPVPEQPFDRFYKKEVPESASREVKPVKAESLNRNQESLPDLTHTNREDAYPGSSTGPNRNNSREPVYLNLPASEKSLPAFTPAASVPYAAELSGEDKDTLNYPDRASVADRPKPPAAKKGLLIGAVILLFGAGMFTGFFISNRRNFYSTDGNPLHVQAQSAKTSAIQPINSEQSGIIGGNGENKNQAIEAPAGPHKPVSQSLSKSRKKSVNSSGKKDSLHTAILPVAVIKKNSDSSRIRQEAENKKLALAAEITTHPENYLLINTGKYKTGVLGGISEVPVTLTNHSGVNIDLAVVAIDYIQRNKKIFKTENLSFHDLAPGAALTEAAPRSSRGVKIRYRLTIVNSQQMGISYSNP